MERELSYDLHIHSCLSPCGDDDMTPGNIVGMAAIKGLDVIAVTDHNSCRNCPAVLKLAEQYPHLTEERYTQRLLELFRRAGLELSADELKILLMLRRETDCMLLRKEQEKAQKDCPKGTM